MNLTYSWEITGIKRKDTTDLKNIIVQTYWKKIGTDENGNSAYFAGATPFDLSSIDINNFIAYEDLTEEQVLSWIRAKVVDSYENHVNEKISQQIEEITNPTNIINDQFPWSSN